ncbi:TadE/TadG family type IV pilus assembly protein [Neorhizobium galegae]|uniref:TadE/TadG family type IV pilus assembly protein n=1 Tax=Neorhizobium galegae TaxID=399 RepID=UPI000622713A|nr:TadE/TadG family type IV pilus assembly protein [Neorhizobium galegae]KAB1122378.1 pilus assembly protein [Neorhizobium galegae]MCQ1805665.1 pilus assembly protein [Neorhizobium galegae]CDZ57961.1 Pilus assembly protein contains TadE domain [Neorhizobium galegae bv. orientalis]
MEEQPIQSQKRSPGVLTRLRQLVADRRGVGAVEFALIAPLLLSLYITSFEITIGLSVSKRVTHSASTIADLVTRETSVDKTILMTMKDVTASLFAPYTPNMLVIKVTGVTLDATGNPTVAWSWDDKDGRPYAIGSAVQVPADMHIANSFLVRAEVSVHHELLMFMPGLLPSEVQDLTIAREYFYRQRLGDSVNCTNC